MSPRIIALLVSCTLHLTVHAGESSTQEIDADIWKVIAKTVATHDIVGMESTYSLDAVLVTPKDSTPVRNALERWGRDMRTMQANGSSASVEFRFSRRQDNAESAFESGIFKYSVKDASGSVKSFYYPFEQLFFKKDGKWRILMERQFPLVSEAEWNKLSPQ